MNNLNNLAPIVQSKDYAQLAENYRTLVTTIFGDSSTDSAEVLTIPGFKLWNENNTAFLEELILAVYTVSTTQHSPEYLSNLRSWLMTVEGWFHGTPYAAMPVYKRIHVADQLCRALLDIGVTWAVNEHTPEETARWLAQRVIEVRKLCGVMLQIIITITDAAHSSIQKCGDVEYMSIGDYAVLITYSAGESLSTLTSDTWWYDNHDILLKLAGILPNNTAGI